MDCYQERAFYYWRHGLYGHVDEVCKIGLSNKNSNLFLTMYSALAKGMIQQTEEALETLSKLSGRKDLILLYNSALYCIHSKAQNPNTQLISQFKKIIDEYSINLNPLATYYSAQIFWLFGHKDICQEFITKSKQIETSVDQNGKSYYPSQASISMTSLQGWIYLTENRVSQALSLFNQILENKNNSYDIFSLCGKAACLVRMRQFSESIQIYARILSKYDFPELQIEKCRVYIYMQRWELVALLQEAKSSLFSSFEANIMIIFNSILMSKSEQVIAALLDELISDCMKYEKQNWFYQMILSFAFGTMCNQSLSIIDRIMRLATAAAETSGNDPVCCSALGFVQLLAHNYVAALSTVPKTTMNNHTDPLGIEFQIRLLIDTGRYSEALDMLDLYELVGSQTVIYQTLRSKLYRKMNFKSNTLTVANSNLNERSIFNDLLKSFENHMKRFYHDDLPYSNHIPLELKFEKYIDFFILYRVDAIIDALDEMVTYNTLLSSDIYGTPAKELGDRLINILSPTLKAMPFFMPFNFFFALLLKKCGKLEDSMYLFEKILSSPNIYRLSQCLVHMAEVSFIQKEEVDFAASCIEEASVEDPTLMTSLDFIILKSRITSNVKDSIRYILKLFDKNSHSSYEYYESIDVNSFVESDTQPFINYIKFIDFCLSADEYKISSELIKVAAKKALQSSDKAMVILRRAKVLAYYKDYEKAFAMLEKLKNHNKYSSKAIEVEAEIYLKFMDDQSKYLSVLYNYSSTSPSIESFSLLGRALRKVKKFNEAIDAYKKGLELYPKSPDEDMLRELIMTYVSANYFNEAVNFFISHVYIMRSSCIFSYDFIKLMIEIKRYQEAMHCISRVIQVHSSKNHLSHAGLLELQGIVESRYLKAHSNGDKKEVSMKDYDGIQVNVSYSSSNENLKNSLAIYEGLLNEVSTINSFTLQMKSKMSNIVYEIGQNYLNLQERERAIDSFFKALEYYPKNTLAVISLFELFKGRYDIERCRKVCLDYLELDPQNETITLLLTSSQTENMHLSIPYLQNVLDVHPTYFRCLVRLVEICARSGKLNVAANYIKKAKCNDPGFYFVKGLYFSYVNNTEKAMKFFKMAKNSNKWEISAKIQIFTLLTNPERKYLWFEEEPFSSEEKLKEAEEIFNSLLASYENTKSNNSSLNYSDIQILKGELLCARNTENSIHEATDVYQALIKENPSFIGGCVGLARCLTKTGEFERAIGLLKFVLTGKPFQENFSYFEETYLMLAFIVEKETNFNSAQHYIYLALELNMSCKKGWEMSAKVQLKRKMYLEASSAFKYCWELCDHSDPEIGYNYAYCCMKAKKYDIALIVSREVMNLYPDYKDLREKVVKPSFQNIKF